MIATETVPFKDFLQYYPYGEDDDKSEILRSIALAMAEVVGKWDIFYADFSDRAQQGMTEYCFGEIEASGFFVQDVISVTLGNKCLRMDHDHCGIHEFGYSYDEATCCLRISPLPEKDCTLRVRAKLGVDLSTICELPKKFFQKYAVHIANYAVYKKELLRRGEKQNTSKAAVSQIYNDAVEFFIRNEYNPYIGQVSEMGSHSPVDFSVCWS